MQNLVIITGKVTSKRQIIQHQLPKKGLTEIVIQVKQGRFFQKIPVRFWGQISIDAIHDVNVDDIIQLQGRVNIDEWESDSGKIITKVQVHGTSIEKIMDGSITQFIQKNYNKS